VESGRGNFRAGKSYDLQHFPVRDGRAMNGEVPKKCHGSPGIKFEMLIFIHLIALYCRDLSIRLNRESGTTPQQQLVKM
jgi:hypothetical protein